MQNNYPINLFLFLVGIIAIILCVYILVFYDDKANYCELANTYAIEHNNQLLTLENITYYEYLARRFELIDCRSVK